MLNNPSLIGLALIILLIVFPILFSILYRKVVSTNMVHIVQSSKKTTSYGTKLTDGNVYYRWPSWIPVVGVTYVKLPVSNFDLSLHNYEAYDIDKVPFMADVTAFFRIDDTTLAAQRVTDVAELQEQLKLIVQGAVRKVLAGDKVETIMLERSKFGDNFTSEVGEQLKEWGVVSVKSMELMDIRDGKGSDVISNIMAKKTSHIRMESRKEVAENNRAAEMAEIEARREVDIQHQQAQQAVGERTAEKEKSVGIAKEKALQEVLTEETETRKRSMDVKRVEQVEQAKITSEEQVVAANQEKETVVIKSEGQLEFKRMEAQGIQLEGEALASAEKAMQLAPVEAQIALAEEIGENDGYQKYLTAIEGLKSYVIVGGKQAEALAKADVKVISNTGNPGEGVTKVMDLFSSKGGTELAAMVEGFAQSPFGKALIEKVAGGTSDNPKLKEVSDEGKSEE